MTVSLEQLRRCHFAVDLGAARTRVYVKGAGLVVDQPSVAAVNTRTGALIAVGEFAEKMTGRTPGYIRVVRPISGGVLNGKALSLPAPLYPEIAKRARTQGLVSVEVVIDVSGRVISAKAVSGPEMLREAAERAAMQARFTPALLSGQPVKMSGTINYNFTF